MVPRNEVCIYLDECEIPTETLWLTDIMSNASLLLQPNHVLYSVYSQQTP
jgi:hypothetical protein